MTTSRAALVAGLCTASLALAQSAPPPLPPPQPPPQEAPPSLPSAARADAPTAPPEPPYQIGVRAGGSAGLGVWFPGPMVSFQPFDLHGGVQVNPMFGAYLRVGYTANIGLNFSASSMGGSVGVAAAGLWLVGANAELGVGDSFFVAGGPQVGIGSWARTRVAAGTTGGSIQAIVSQGAHPGLDLKIGFALGQPNRQTRRRSQATIALDLSMLYATNVTEASVSGSTSGASIAVNFTEALAVVPTLQVGFEFR